MLSVFFAVSNVCFSDFISSHEKMATKGRERKGMRYGRKRKERREVEIWTFNIGRLIRFTWSVGKEGEIGGEGVVPLKDKEISKWDQSCERDGPRGSKCIWQVIVMSDWLTWTDSLCRVLVEFLCDLSELEFNLGLSRAIPFTFFVHILFSSSGLNRVAMYFDCL